jgi:hypothetical protein
MVMVVLLVMLSLLLMPVSSVVTNAKFSGAIGAILSNFWVNGMGAILTRFEVALATTSAAISTVMLPSGSDIIFTGAGDNDENINKGTLTTASSGAYHNKVFTLIVTPKTTLTEGNITVDQYCLQC